MQITDVCAENFLSFGVGTETFRLEGLGALSVLVGPNGAGKSNVLEVVRTLKAALGGATEGVHSLAGRRHWPDGHARSAELRLGVVFDRPEEQNLIAAVLRAATAYPANDYYRGIAQVSFVESDSRPTLNNVLAARQDALAAWIRKTVTKRALAPFFRATLRFFLDEELGLDESLFFEFDIGHGHHLALGVGGRSPKGTFFDPASDGPITSGHVARVWVDQLDLNIRTELAKFLHGTRKDLPDLQLDLATAIAAQLRREAQTISTGLGANGRTTMPIMRDLVRAAAPFALRVDQLDLATVLSAVVTRSIAIISDWQPELDMTVVDEHAVAAHDALVQVVQGRQLQPGYDTGVALGLADAAGSFSRWTESPIANLARGDLARFMLRLEHGSLSDQELLHRVQGTFQSLTGHTGRIRLDLDQRALRVHLETEQGIALANSGSGVAQALYLSAVVQGYDGTVLMLDEPELHLHPTLKGRLPELLSGAVAARSSQYLIVAHSPYAVPTPSFRQVRHVRQEGGHSIVSRLLTEQEIDDAGLRIQTKAQSLDEKAFLFSNAVCFVEGPRDAAAYAVWFDLWAQEQRGQQNYATQIGLVFQAAHGADRLAGMLMAAKALGIPALGVYDTDVLSSHNKLRDDNRHRIRRWEELELVERGRIRLESQQSLALLSVAPSLIRVLQPQPRRRMAFRANLETILRVPIREMTYADGKDSPAAYGQVAREVGLPKSHRAFLESLFTDLAAMAELARP